MLTLLTRSRGWHGYILKMKIKMKVKMKVKLKVKMKMNANE
jgi:hypothetical protein